MRVVVAMLLCANAAGAADLRAHAAECATRKPPNARVYWSYRIVDGHPCWYAGRPGKSKTELHWAADPQSRQPSGVGRSGPVLAPPTEPGASTREEVMQNGPGRGAGHNATPASPPGETSAEARALTFDQRWNDLLNDLAMPFTRWRAPLKDQTRFGE